jgi:thiol-disulfide isomerase/thioredoxin
MMARSPISRKILLAAGPFLLIVGLALFLPVKPRMPHEKSFAPNFTYPGLAAKPVSLSDFKGQLVLLDFWATWCDPCKEEVPDLIRLHQSYQARGFSVLGVATDSNGASSVAPFAHDYQITYPLALSEGDIPKGYLVPGFPVAYLIARDGQIIKRYIGQTSYDEFVADIERALQNEPLPKP